MPDLNLLAEHMTAFEQRLELHLQGDRAKNDKILALTDDVAVKDRRIAELEALLASVGSPAVNEQYASLLQRFAIGYDKL